MITSEEFEICFQKINAAFYRCVKSVGDFRIGDTAYLLHNTVMPTYLGFLEGDTDHLVVPLTIATKSQNFNSLYDKLNV